MIGEAGRDVLLGGLGSDYLEVRDGLPDVADGGPDWDYARPDRKGDRVLNVEAIDRR
jgi:hypothetical protein